MPKRSRPEVFIIESLNLVDERKDRLEGQPLCSMLSMSGKKCKYFYIRTRTELPVILKEFGKSRYRYLHISCHGGERATKTLHTTCDPIRFNELAPMLEPYIGGKRLFISACETANKFLGNRLMCETGCLSILGPKDAIEFKTSAIFWAALYHIVFQVHARRIKTSVLREKIQQVVNMFGVPMNFMTKNEKQPCGYDFSEINPEK